MMPEASAVAPVGPRSLRSMAGPLAMLVITVLGVGAVLWGYFNPPDIRVVQFDAGPVSQWKAQRTVGFPSQHIYIVGLDDGRLRALDTRIEASHCVARWLPDDARGTAKNPAGLPGVFEDTCSGGVWSMIGDAISGSDKPMRTPLVETRPDTRGYELHIWVELVNPDR